MKKEYKYFGAILSIFLLAILTLFLLLRKYSLLTFQHFVETCQQILPTFFSSGVHFIGLALVVLTSLIMIVFFGKTLLSLIKTQRKIDNLLNYKLNVFPDKLGRILAKLDINKDVVLVIDKNTSHAFNYGLLSRKIVLSKGLINKLDSKQLEAVVLHEAYHLRGKHSLLLVISEILSSTMFFMPIVNEISRKMRVVFEKQADLFTTNVQGGDSHLKVALLKVPSSRIQFYPQLAMRQQHETAKRSVVGSMFAIFVVLSLLLFPVSTHATELSGQIVGGECSQSQCSTHCPTDNVSSEPNMSSASYIELASTPLIY